MNEELTWVEVYRATIGRLTDEEADQWKEVIREAVPGVTMREVKRAVTVLGNRKMGPHDRRPLAREIIRQVWDYRKAASNHGSESVACKPMAMIADRTKDFNDDERYVRVSMTELKQQLTSCNDPDKAWEIICSPLDTNQCRALCDYAYSYGIKYNRFDPSKLRTAAHGATERLKAKGGRR